MLEQQHSYKKQDICKNIQKPQRLRDRYNAHHSDYDRYSGQRINRDVEMLNNLVAILHVLPKHFYKKKLL